MNIEIRGLSELRKKLDDLKVIEVLTPPMQDAVIRLEGRMKSYPSQRSGSTYKRTGSLGRRWTTKVTKQGDSIVGTVGNVTVYGPFVQSQQFQRPPFRGRWQTDVQVLNEEKDNITRDFERAVAEAL